MECMDTFGLLQHITPSPRPPCMFLDIYSILSSHHRLMTLMYSLRSGHTTFLIIALLNVNYLSLVLLCWSRKFLIGSSNRLIWIILDRTLHHLFCAIHSGQASKNWLSVMIPLCHKSWINTPREYKDSDRKTKSAVVQFGT